MRSIRIEFHSNSTGGSELRLFNDSGKLVDRRPVNAESLELLLHQTNVEYKFPFREQLLDLGQDLYDFLDGQEKWLSREQAASRKSLLVRIDTQGRLSHLPWELLRNQGVYLCPLSHGALLPVRQVGVEVQSLERANRALRLFFMASDPIDTKVPLSFEEEEARILQATQKVPLEIEVEESGSLAGLKDRWYYFGEDHFDILHLVGHAKGGGIKGPVFIMEDDEGYSDPITPERLLSVFGEQWPKLIFVSGCETGKAQASGALLSFCERLAQAGAPAVLGWALPVRDGTAMQVAQEIYSNLSYGRTADQALLEARVAVYESERESERLGKYENWHLLRLYCDGTALGSYVTPQASGHVKFAPRPPAERVFLDAQEQKKEICSRQRFVGRRRFIQRGLRTLRAAVDSMDYAEGVLLQGMGGLGKTSLAVRLCERLPHRRFVNVGQFNEEKLLGLLSRNLETSDAIETLQQPGLPFETRLRLLLKGPLHQKPAIIVLDDFEDNIEMSSDGRTPLQIEGQSLCTLQPAPLETLKALLRAIRESGSDTRLLITCRYDLMVPGPATLRVERLQGFQGVELNKKLSQLDYLNEQFGRSDELKQKVLNLAAGNARLMERLDRVIVSSASDAKRVLFAMEDTSQEFREEILLENLIEQQPVTSKRLLAILSLLHLPIPWTLFEEIAETPEARALLARSTALGLVEIGQKVKGEEEAIYVSSLLGPLLHDAFNDASRREMQARASQVLDQAQWRNVSIYWETRSREVLRLALEGRNNETAATVGSDLVHGLNNQSRYREAALLSEQVSKTLIDYRVLMAWGRSETVLGDTESALEHFEESLRKAPPIDARDHDANKIVGATLNNLANAIAQQGDIPRAMSLWEQSLQIEESIGNQSGIAITLHQMAGIVAQQGNIPRAMNLWEQALQIHKDIGDAKGEAATLHNIAGIVAQLGDIQRALKLWEQALQIHKDIGDAKGKAATLHQMAGIVAQLGDIQRATRLWEQSLQIGESIGDQSGMAATLHQMAGIVAQLGNIPRAMKLWEQALQIHKDIGDAKGKAATLSNMAEIIAQRGDIPRAMKLWNQSLQIKEDIGDAQGKAATLHQMAGIVAQLGDIQRAMSLWERSLQIHEDIGDAQGEAATLHQMAGIVAQLGDIQRAMSLWKQSLQIKEDIGDAQGKAATLSNMAEIVAQQGDIPRAMSLWEQSLQIHEDIGDAQGKAATLHQMAGIVAQLGDIQRAMSLWKQSLQIKEAIGNAQGKAATLSNMAGIVAQQGDIPRAMSLWEQSLQILKATGGVKGQATTLSNMAGIVAQQGDIPRAMSLWEQSLQIQEDLGDAQGKAATLSNMAGIVAQQGDIQRAMSLWEQSLQILKAIGDAKGKATTLNNMAGFVAQQGDIPRAMKLWEQSLQIQEDIGNAQGKAATLSNMGWAAGQTGNREKERTLYIQAAQAFGEIQAFGGLIKVVENLGASEDPVADRYLAQAFWLSTRLRAPVAGLLNLSGFFVKELGAEHAVSPWIAGATLALIQIHGQEHPEAQQLQQHAGSLLLHCAAERGIPKEDWPDWIQTYLNPQLLFPTLFHHLEEMIGDTWFFDPALVPNPFEQQPTSSNDEAPAPPPEGGEAGAG